MNLFTKNASGGQPPAGTIHWLNACVERGKREVFSEVITLTPGLAAELLRRNDGNRSVRRTKVAQYADDIRAGRWVFNGESIILSDTGELNDGQHRCAAVVEANLSITIMVAFGFPRDSRLTIDQGAARGAADYAGMEGISNATVVASIARLVIAFEKNDARSFTSIAYLTNAEVLDRIHSDSDLAHSATFASSNAKFSKRFAAPAIIGFCHYIFTKISAECAAEYMTQVCRGEGIKARDPAYTIRDRLLNLDSKSREKRIHIIFRGWNAYRQGRTLGLAKIMGDGNMPGLV